MLVIGGATSVRHLLITITVVIAVTFSVLAQSTAKPDFSGSWVLNIVKSTLAKDTKTKSESIVIDYKKSTIVFHFNTDGKKSTETYTPDGQKRVVRDMSSGQLISKASWQNSVLVIESTLEINVPNVVVDVTGRKPVVDTWTLATDGRALTHEIDNPKQIFVYDKH
jgi:hypothetical protein